LLIADHAGLLTGETATKYLAEVRPLYGCEREAALWLTYTVPIGEGSLLAATTDRTPPLRVAEV
jgi:hypothetical protein